MINKESISGSDDYVKNKNKNKEGLRDQDDGKFDDFLVISADLSDKSDQFKDKTGGLKQD